MNGPVTLVDTPVNAELNKLLLDGKEVEAIKLARERLGLSVVNSKRYIALPKENY